MKRGNERQDKDKVHYDVNRDYEQLCASPAFDEIEHDEPLAKLSAPKCLDYQGTKDLLTHMQHFKKTMVHVSLTQDKRDAMMYKLFPIFLYDGA